MSMFNRKPAAEPEEITGSELLRLRLKSLARSPGGSISNVARDVNEALIEAATREHALSLAKKMAGEDASKEVLNDIAKSMMGSLSGGTGRTLSVGESQLRDFIDRKIDLVPEIKTELGRYFYDKNVFYERRARSDAYPPQPPADAPPITPEQWRHPSPEVEAARKAYHQALANYQASISPPPPPRKPLTEEQMRPSWSQRAGFAERS